MPQWACLVGSNDKVTCTRFDAFFGELGPADQRMMDLALNDLVDTLGGNGATDALVACGKAGNQGATHLMAMASGASGPSAASSLGTSASTGAARGLTPATRGATSNLRSLARPLGGAPTNTGAMVSACRQAQMASIREGLGALTPRDANYQQAVNTAVAAVDAAVASCRDSNTGLVAADAATTTAPAPAGNPGDNAPDVALNVINTSLGAAATILEATKSPVGAVTGALGVVGSLAGLGGNELGEVTGQAVDIVGGYAEISSLVGTAEGGAAAALTAETVYPITAAFAAGYSVVRAVNFASGGAVDRKAVELFGKASDAVWELANGGAATSASTSKPGVGRPSTDGGRPSCSEIAARWAALTASCSASNNNWQTYDCMLLVARLNACADPGLVNPGPEGDYTCRAGSAADGTVATCEQREQLRGWLTISGFSPAGSGLSGCQASVGAGMRVDLMEQVRAQMCQQISPSPDGSGPCAGALPGR